MNNLHYEKDNIMSQQLVQEVKKPSKTQLRILKDVYERDYRKPVSAYLQAQIEAQAAYKLWSDTDYDDDEYDEVRSNYEELRRAKGKLQPYKGKELGTSTVKALMNRGLVEHLNLNTTRFVVLTELGRAYCKFNMALPIVSPAKIFEGIADGIELMQKKQSELIPLKQIQSLDGIFFVPRTWITAILASRFMQRFHQHGTATFSWKGRRVFDITEADEGGGYIFWLGTFGRYGTPETHEIVQPSEVIRVRYQEDKPLASSAWRLNLDSQGGVSGTVTTYLESENQPRYPDEIEGTFGNQFSGSDVWIREVRWQGRTMTPKGAYRFAWAIGEVGNLLENLQALEGNHQRRERRAAR